MPFPLREVPTVFACPHCGKHIRDANLSEGFEILIARWLRAELAMERQRGYDIHKSTLFPNRTFQVKYAYPSAVQRKWGSNEVWEWSDGQAIGQADYYILFGVRKGLVHCFLLNRKLWDRLSSGKTSSILYSPTYCFSRRGRGKRVMFTKTGCGSTNVGICQGI
jgi:hypothetical protein